MNSSYEARLADYRKGDFNYRLHLFLQLPKMRPEFMAIEEEEGHRYLSSEVKLHTHPLTSQLMAALKSANNSLKRILRFA